MGTTYAKLARVEHYASRKGLPIVIHEWKTLLSNVSLAALVVPT